METWGLQGLEVLRDGIMTLALFLCVAGLLVGAGNAVPTRRAFFWLLVPIPLILLSLAFPRQAALMTGLNWGLVIYNAGLLATLMLDRFFLSVPPGSLTVQRVLNPKFSIGQPNPVQLNLVNNSTQALQGTVQDDAPPATPAPEQNFTLPAFGRASLNYHLTPTERGTLDFGKTLLRYRSRLGLLWIRQSAGRSDTVRVYPDLRLIRRMRVRYARGQAAGNLQKHHLGLEGTQFSGLRGYSPGDDVRHLSWTATARLDSPVVRTFTHEVEQPILLMLDGGRHMAARAGRLTKFDHALNTALAFATVAMERGDQVGAGVFSNKLTRWLPLASGAKHMQTLLETLSSVQLESVEPDYEALMLHAARQLKRRSLVIVLTDLIDPIASKSLLKGLQSFSRNHLLMVVTLRDPKLQQEACSLPTTPQEAYRKGVALDLLTQRQSALAALSRTRQVVTIDAAPEQLSEALIQEYLSIKLRNRL